MENVIHEVHDGSQCMRQVQEATMQREGHHRVTAATATAGGQLGRWNWQRHVEIDRRVSSGRPWFLVHCWSLFCRSSMVDVRCRGVDLPPSLAGLARVG